MIRFTLIILSLILLAVPAAAQNQSRYGIVLYEPPAGWARQEKDNLLLLISPDKDVTVVICPSLPLTYPLEKIGDELLWPRPRCAPNTAKKPNVPAESTPALEGGGFR